MNEQPVTETLISREEALLQHRKFFFTGKPCLNDHLSRRYTSTSACVQCLRNGRNKKLIELRAMRMQRGRPQDWAIVEAPTAQIMDTALATLKALGCSTKGPFSPSRASVEFHRPADLPGEEWKPPQHLVNPVVESGPVDMGSWADLQPAPLALPIPFPPGHPDAPRKP